MARRPLTTSMHIVASSVRSFVSMSGCTNWGVPSITTTIPCDIITITRRRGCIERIVCGVHGELGSSGWVVREDENDAGKEKDDGMGAHTRFGGVGGVKERVFEVGGGTGEREYVRKAEERLVFLDIRRGALWNIRYISKIRQSAWGYGLWDEYYAGQGHVYVGDVRSASCAKTPRRSGMDSFLVTVMHAPQAAPAVPFNSSFFFYFPLFKKWGGRT